ncbi:MAG: Na+/H+ antiporter subunit C [Acidobacteriia bacterium]|nr:Na+/H+ antiporter subunit C [Terriglobia bacterium]MYC66129.1 Na+/H+ antiporter subunit C [Terriglobia bacterium]
MEAVIAVLVGVLMASSVYLMLRRNLVRFVLGLALISHTANLLIFSSGGLQGRFPPLISPGELEPVPGAANALPQALMLTAIVISFSVFAFLLVLAFRTYQRLETVDPDAMRSAEPVPAEAGTNGSVAGGPQ